MKRLIYTGLLLATLLAALFAAGCSDSNTNESSTQQPRAAEPVRLTYANFPPAFTVPCVQMERWKEEVQTRTRGAVQVETFPGGTLLKAKNMLRGVMEGQADIGCVAMSYQPGVFPLSTAVEMPVGFTSGKASSQTLWALFEKYRPAELEQVKVLTMFATPPSNIMSRVPVQTLEQVQGLELRGNGASGRFLDALGAVTVSMPMPEVPDALQKNMIQGLFTSLEVLQDMKFAEFCPYATIMDGPVYIFAVVMNQDRWNALPQEAKDVLDALAPEQAAWTGQYWDSHTAEAVDWARKEHGLQVFTLSDQDKTHALEQSAALVQDWKERAVKAGLPAEAVLADVLAWKQEFDQ
ncbi:MAG: TRAP transporter substrate-binding protein [Desulfovibrio sp.]